MKVVLNFYQQHGYIALISAIIISVLLVIISISISATGFFSRFNVSDAEYKKRSSALAEACIDSALLKLAEDPSYAPAAGGDSVNVGSDTCTIFSVSTVGSQSTVQSKAIFQKAVANIQVVVDNSDFSLITWQELPSL